MNSAVIIDRINKSYSTSQSNIYSQNIAMKAGFFPAWVEAYSTEPKED